MKEEYQRYICNKKAFLRSTIFIVNMQNVVFIFLLKNVETRNVLIN